VIFKTIRFITICLLNIFMSNLDNTVGTLFGVAILGSMLGGRRKKTKTTTTVTDKKTGKTTTVTRVERRRGGLFGEWF